jgi:hypothetical protein
MCRSLLNREASGSFGCIVKYLIDEVEETINKNAHISFVNEKENGSSMSFESMQSTTKPHSLSKIQHKYFLNAVTLVAKLGNKTELTLEHIDSFCGTGDASLVMFDSEGKRFFTLGTALFHSTSSPKVEAKDESEEVISIPPNPNNLTEASDRLSKYTSADEVNPTTLVQMETTRLEEGDDFDYGWQCQVVSKIIRFFAHITGLLES